MSLLGEVLESDLQGANESQQDPVLAELGVDTLTPERVAQARSALQEIEGLFFNDPEALNVIRALALGHSPEEAQAEFNVSTLNYSSTQRRIRRTLAKHFTAKRQA